MPTEPLFPLELAGPFTPRKSASNSPAPASQPNQPRSNKARNGNKARAKQVGSPGHAKQGRTTPPQTTASRTIAAPAFAGATFHASPAPSSLPIPSFLAKAALDSPSVQGTSRIDREPSPPATDSEAPTPRNRLLPTDAAPEESPLDIFFRADRAEKERARRASSANILAVNPSPFSPPAQQIRSPQEVKTVPPGLFGSRGVRQQPRLQRNSSSGISASELDGTPGMPLGPAFSTPYQDRIRAARSTEKPAVPPAQKPSPAPALQEAQATSSAQDLSEKLKRFLAIPSVQGGANGGQAPSQQQMATGALSPGSADETATNTFSASSTAALSAPAAAKSLDTGNCRSPDIKHMEESLRRMLKIGVGGGSPSTSVMPFGRIPPPPTTRNHYYETS
ncbi:hypothetical protein VTK26DRAFT_5012 [Humicola hyalothermophila]